MTNAPERNLNPPEENDYIDQDDPMIDIYNDEEWLFGEETPRFISSGIKEEKSPSEIERDQLIFRLAKKIRNGEICG